MKDLELNKIAASILLAGLIAMLCGFFTDIFYTPYYKSDTRGYKVDISEIENNNVTAEEEEIIIAEIMKLASLEKGKSVAKKCSACHSFDKNGPNKIGPNLWNIIGSDIASSPNYAYSKAFNALDGKWGYEEIYAFLNKPKKYAPGTKMAFAGLKKQKDIASMIEFLRNNSDNPIPLPN